VIPVVLAYYDDYKRAVGGFWRSPLTILGIVFLEVDTDYAQNGEWRSQKNAYGPIIIIIVSLDE
jgi:hypothetical protein